MAKKREFPPISRCSGCEQSIREGDKLYLLVDCVVKGGEMTYRAIDAFHQDCYHPEVKTEIPDGEAPEPLPPHDPPPPPTP
jgi:hypothetical protein